MAKCNKCNREGLSWGKKTLKDGKVINILFEADSSEHRPYKDGEAKCNITAPEQKVDPNQQKLPTPQQQGQPQPKPEPKVNLNDNVPKLVEIDDILSTLAKHQCQKLYQPLFQSEALTSAEVELLIHKEKQLLEIARSKLLS